jgi:hypothetical protein
MHEGREKDPNQTFTGPDAECQFKECASQYRLDPTAAALVLGIINALFWAGIIIVVVPINWKR